MYVGSVYICCVVGLLDPWSICTFLLAVVPLPQVAEARVCCAHDAVRAAAEAMAGRLAAWAVALWLGASGLWRR